MRIAYWNRLKSADAAAQADWLAGSCEVGCPRWDVLLLSEVPKKSVAVFAERLGEGAEVADWTGQPSTGRQPHGLMAFSRVGPLGKVRVPSEPAAPPPSIDPRLVAEVESWGGEPWMPRQPLKERWMAFDLDVAGRTVSVAGAQMPFAAGKNYAESLHNRLSKREAYRQLAVWASAEREAGRPVVLGLDGNNWWDWDTPESVQVSPVKRSRVEHSRMLDAADLFDQEHQFHGPGADHGLVDSLRTARNAGLGQDPHGSAGLAARFELPYAATYLLKRDGHRMDRIYISPEIGVEAAGVCHGHHQREAVAQLGKGDGLCLGSDHALVWTDLAIA